MKKLFIREELRTLQQKLSNEKESENILKKVEINIDRGNHITKPKSSEKIGAEKRSEKIGAEKSNEVKMVSISTDLLQALLGIQTSSNDDRLL